MERSAPAAAGKIAKHKSQIANQEPDWRTDRRQRAFTVLELLVSVSIMTVIIFGLYQMFNRTQRALRGNITQVDVLESGRAAMEMIGRELEQLTACELAKGTNLFAALIPAPALVLTDLDERGKLRTNVLQEFFFLSRSNNMWLGTGYRVMGAVSGVGTLYRFSVATNHRHLTSANLSGRFVTEPMTNPVTRTLSTNFHRVADGIVHLRLAAYDPDGRRFGLDTTNLYPSYSVLRQSSTRQPIPLNSTDNVVLRRESAEQTSVIFLSNALPAYIELELGVLEPEAFSRYRSLRVGGGGAAENFLRNQANRVHLFRQRIPIRTATK